MKAFASSSFRHYGQIRQPAPIVEDAIAHVGHGGAAEDMVKMLTQRIVDLSSRLVAKDELASQQSRIAKDAVQDLIKKDEQLKQHALAIKEEKSAREQAETGYLSLRQELDKVCQQKGLVEARMVQLNGALKECMDEMRHAKEQLEYKTQEATSRKRDWDKLRNELDTENAQLKRQSMEATAENIAISKSLQERGRSLNEINETRAKVESDSEILQVQIESLHKDMDAYKYEIHLLKKELQIRNDEKEQNRKLADATHKQHLESVKKIAKLDSECNRLRALVRKKLPGPAAIAQMRVEADHVGKKRMPSPKMSPDQRDMEALSDRLMAMEDETKLLKESLAKKTAELQSARQLCARTASKLSSAEGIIEAMARGQAAVPALCIEGNHGTLRSNKCDSMQQESFAVSVSGGGGETMEVMDWAVSSEDGNNNDDELSSAESWASALIAELSHLKKDDRNLTTKTDGNGKRPGLRIIDPLVQDFDLQTALQELNIKLSAIGESILALPSSMRTCVGDQGLSGNEIKPLSFGMLGQIMEEFTFVKQLLVEVQKAVEFEETNQSQVVQSDRSLQRSNTNKTDGSVVINNECNEDVKIPAEIDSENETLYNKGLLRKVMEASFNVSAESKQVNSESGAEGAFVRLQMAMDALADGGRDLHNLSEVAATELLCKIGELVKENCIASCAPANVVDGQNLVEETGLAGEIDMSVGKLDVLQGTTGRETAITAGDDDELISGTCTVDANDGTIEIGGDCDATTTSSCVDGKPIGVDEDKLLDVGENSVDSVINKLNVGCSNGVDSVSSDNKLNVGEREETIGKLTLQMELLQHEVERLTAERDEVAAKLADSHARIATLDAESLLLASDKASLAQQLSDASARNQGLEEDLADARASLDDLRQQVSSLNTVELPDQAAQPQGNFMSLSDVGTPPKGRSTDAADGKHHKEREIASAKAQLAECQRTILVLGNQLRALSSVQDHVAAVPSFDSSLESATSTDQMNLPPMALADGGERSSRSRRAQPGYVRTRGGRLVSAEQYWGSSGDIPVAGGENQSTPSYPGPSYSYSSRHLVLPRHSYPAACAQSPLHEYVSEHSAYVYSPPETALSSPATSPARYNFPLDRALKAPPVPGPAGVKITNKAAAGAAAAGFPPPSPARRTSRIARFFARAKNQ